MKVLLENITQDSPHQKRIPNPVKIQELADSIREEGLRQPPTLRPFGENGYYEIVFGHNRIAAARLLGWKEIEVVVDKKLTDKQAHRLTISENVSRADLSTFETALAMEDARKDFGMEETAKIFKVTKETVLSYLRILELPNSVQELVHEGKIAKSAVSAMLAFFDIFGEKELLSQYQRATRSNEDIGSHELIDNLNNQLKWQSRAQFASLFYGDRPEYDFPLDRVFPLKTTLAPKKAKAMELAKITDGDAYDKLQMQIKGGLEMLAQPWLAEGLTQMQVEKIVCYTSPPACIGCPFIVTIKGATNCSFKTCLKRKKDSWHFIKFTEYLEASGLMKYSKKDDGLGLALSDTLYRDSDITQDKYAKMITEGKTSNLRIEPRYTDNGVYVGTHSKYARLIDVSKAGIKKAAKLHEERVAQREQYSSGGYGDYYSPERVAARKLEHDKRDAFIAFYHEQLVDLIAGVMTISIPELVVFHGLEDKDVKDTWDVKVTKANRLSLYRKRYLWNESRNLFGWVDWEKTEHKDYIELGVKPKLLALGIWKEVPTEFDEMVESFFTDKMAELAEIVEEEDSVDDDGEDFEDDGDPDMDDDMGVDEDE